MKVSQWAEIRRLDEMEGLSGRGIARRLGCDRSTVKKALEQAAPPDESRRVKRTTMLAPYHDKIAALLAQSPGLSAVRITEAVRWRDKVANVRRHQTTGERPVDRFEQEREHLRALPGLPADTDEVVATVVSHHARVAFDGNRYSTPVEVVGKPVTVRAGADVVRVLHEGREVARHRRSYAKRKVIRHAEHELQALRMRKRNRSHHLEETFDALGDVAREFHLQLQQRPVKTGHHLRRLLELVRVYGRQDVLAAIAGAHQLKTYDAAYVETLLLQERRRRELPSPTPLRPARHELIEEIDIEPSDPAVYDRLFRIDDQETKEESHDQT